MGGSTSKSRPAKAQASPQSASRDAWTFNVYLAGDNSLTEEMTWALQEIKKACTRLDFATHGVNVVAHFDPRGSRGRKYCFVPPNCTAASGARASQSGDGDLRAFETLVYTDAFIAASAPAVSNASARQLLAFLADQVNHLRPAAAYFVVLSGHGSGATGDFLTDVDPGTSLSIPELARILALGRDLHWQRFRDREIDGARKRIGVLGMDSCLMSTAEVCYEIRDHAHFLVASEGFVSNTGWPYHRVLEAMIDPATAAPETAPLGASTQTAGDPHREVARRVSQRVATTYSEFYRDYEISDISTDIAVCDLAAFRAKSPLVAALRKLAAACIPRLEDVAACELAEEADRTALDKLVKELAREIAVDLEDPSLENKLLHGSADAVTYLSSPELSRRPLTPSRARALVGLLDSLDGRYHVRSASLKTRLQGLRTAIATELSPSAGSGAAPGRKGKRSAAALSVVRAIRECDPGVEEALRKTVAKEATGDPRGKRARARLQKLHQALCRRDLSVHAAPRGSGTKDPKRLEARGLRDALTAARWEAQSFKGGLYVDLFDFCQCLSERTDAVRGVVASCRAVMRAIGPTNAQTSSHPRAVVLSRYTGPAFQHAHGLSIYYPVDARDYTSAYDNLALAQATGWGRFVRAYLRSTRRSRRDERQHWSQIDDPIRHLGDLEADPLETGTIEDRIAGVDETRATDVLMPEDVRTGTERKIREGTERRIREGTERRIREGTERRIREGTERRIREGTERRIRGKTALAVLGNPPDGFYRQP